MIGIKGIYTIPNARHVFFIVSSLSKFSNNAKLLEKSKKRTEYFEHILHSKDHIVPRGHVLWTLKLVPENGFLQALTQQHTIRQVSTNPSFHNPEDMELLAINLLKSPLSYLDSAFNTPKILSNIADEDIIEVFI